MAKARALELLNKRKMSLKLSTAHSWTEFNSENKKIQKEDKHYGSKLVDSAMKKSTSLPTLNGNTTQPLMQIISSSSMSRISRKFTPPALELIKEEVANEGLETDAGEH